jgi:parallel beta-helix repeat protein
MHVYNGDSIQEAINSSQPGDTIFIHEGIYHEQLIVDKTVGIIGSGQDTIIDGGGVGTVIFVRYVSGVNISGLVIQNSGGFSYISRNCGIHLMHCRRCNISRNVFTKNYYGVGLTDSYENLVNINILRENSCGVLLSNSTENVICHNSLSRNLSGIELRYSEKNRISNNLIEDGSYQPISLIQASNENNVTNNVLSNNTGCIYISNSDNNIIGNNSLTQNRYGGIVLYEARHNLVTQNEISGSLEEDLGAIQLSLSEYNSITKNILRTKKIGIDLLFAHSNSLHENQVLQASYWGIGLGQSNNNSIIFNTVKECKRAILLIANASHGHSNRIFHNNFISNIDQTDLRGSNYNSWDDGIEGNYWSDYTGEDTDEDMLGDSLYTIDENNRDNYPLTGMLSEFPVMDEENIWQISFICNFPISEFQFDTAECLVSFNSNSNQLMENETLKARICVPNALIVDLLKILVNKQEPTTQVELPITNDTHTFIYFTYEVPASPFWIQWWFWAILISGMVTVLFTIVFLRRRKTQSAYPGEVPTLFARTTLLPSLAYRGKPIDSFPVLNFLSPDSKQ